MKRAKFIAVLGTAFLVFGIIACAALDEYWESAITRKNFLLIENGMTDSSVYQIIGRPHDRTNIESVWGGVRRETWYSHDTNIQVEFDRDRRVVRAHHWFDPDARPSLLRRLTRHAGIDRHVNP